MERQPIFINQKIRRLNIVKDGNIFQTDLWIQYNPYQNPVKICFFTEIDKLILKSYANARDPE